MSDEKSPAYQVETPWQRIGKTSKAGYASVEEALKAGGLDWEVELRDLFYLSGKPGAELTRDYKKVPNRKAVVRTSDDGYLGTVGTIYQPMQNADAFGVLDTACKEHGVIITGAGFFHDGRRVWMQAQLPEGIEVVDGDLVKGYFLIASGHDGGAPYTARSTPMRVACLNSLMAALRGSPALVMLRHTSNHADELALVASMVNRMMGALRASGQTFTRLAQMKLNAKTIEQYIDTVLNIMPTDQLSASTARRRARILELVTTGKGNEMAPSSAWAAYNAFTEYFDHVRPAEVSAKSAQRANESALFGANARLKQKAFDIATRLAA